jgi:RNA polymerase sigma factor (sigma-70 family)
MRLPATLPPTRIDPSDFLLLGPDHFTVKVFHKLLFFSNLKTMDNPSIPAGSLSDNAEQRNLSSFNKREQQAFHITYKLYSQDVWLFLTSRLRNDSYKDDILHDCFIALWLSKKKFKKPRKLKSYLFGIAHKKIADRIEYLKRHKPLGPGVAAPDASPDKKLLQADNQIIYNAAIKKMGRQSPLRQAAIGDKFLKGKSDQDIAEENGVEKNRIRSERAKGLRSLRDDLGNDL